MPDRGQHCPFLNRTDARCSRHFSLDALDYAFDYCFDYYEGCAVYLELLAERRVRRARGLDFDGAGDDHNHHTPSLGLVQVTVAGRVAHGAPDPAYVSHASGV